MYNIIKKLFKMQKNENEKIDMINIQQELLKFTKDKNQLIYSIIDIIQEKLLYDLSWFEYFYLEYEKIEFIYNIFKKPVCIKEIFHETRPVICNNEFNITSDFYDGYGYDIYKK